MTLTVEPSRFLITYLPNYDVTTPGAQESPSLLKRDMAQEHSG